MSTDLLIGKQKQRNTHLHTSEKHLSSPTPRLNLTPNSSPLPLQSMQVTLSPSTEAMSSTRQGLQSEHSSFSVAPSFSLLSSDPLRVLHRLQSLPSMPAPAWSTSYSSDLGIASISLFLFFVHSHVFFTLS